jgi:sugar phosphate isomerase/epimerase
LSHDFPKTPKLIASCWTSAGNVAPLSTPETSPVPIEERIEPWLLQAGQGLGSPMTTSWRQGHHWLSAVAKTLRPGGLSHIEVELLSNWWDDSRQDEWRPQLDLLLDAAEALGASFIKVGTAIGDGLDDYGQFVAPLQQLTKEAANRGTRIALEPMAFLHGGFNPPGS